MYVRWRSPLAVAIVTHLVTQSFVRARTVVRRRSGWVADRVSRPPAVVMSLVLLSRLARVGVATVG